MSDHVVHTFNADNGIHPCVICGRDAIVCPECERCTVCLHAEPLGAGASTRKGEGGTDSTVGTPAPNHVELPDIFDRIKGIVYGDTPDLDGYEGTESLWEVRRACEGIITAARSLKSAADKGIAESLGNNATRLDDSFLYAGPKKTMVVYNSAGLFDYLDSDIRECFRADDIRISSLRAVAKKRLLETNPDVDDQVLKKSVEAIVNSFIDWDKGDPELHVLPITRAPQYAASLHHGEIKERKPRP